MEESRKRSFKVHEMWSKPKKHPHLLMDRPENFVDKLTRGGAGDGAAGGGLRADSSGGARAAKTDEEILAGLGLGRRASREKFTQSLRERLLQGTSLGDIGSVMAAKERAPRRTGGHVYPVRKGSARKGEPAPQTAAVREEFAEWMGEIAANIVSPSSRGSSKGSKSAEEEHGQVPGQEKEQGQDAAQEEEEEAPPRIDDTVEDLAAVPDEVAVPPQELFVAFVEVSSNEDIVTYVEDNQQVDTVHVTPGNYLEPVTSEYMAVGNQEVSEEIIDDQPVAEVTNTNRIEEEDCIEDPCNEPSWFKEYGIDKASRKYKYATLKGFDSDSDKPMDGQTWSIDTPMDATTFEDTDAAKTKKHEGGQFARHRVKKKCSICLESESEFEVVEVQAIQGDVSFLALDDFFPSRPPLTPTEVDAAKATAGSTFLKAKVGKYLVRGMVQVALVKPKDPVEYLAHWLLAERDKEDRLEERRNLENEIINIKRKAEEERKEKRQTQALLEEGMKFYSKHQNALCRTSSIELKSIIEEDEYDQMKGEEGYFAGEESDSPVQSIETPTPAIDLSEAEHLADEMQTNR